MVAIIIFTFLWLSYLRGIFLFIYTAFILYIALRTISACFWYSDNRLVLNRQNQADAHLNGHWFSVLLLQFVGVTSRVQRHGLIDAKMWSAWMTTNNIKSSFRSLYVLKSFVLLFNLLNTVYLLISQEHKLWMRGIKTYRIIPRVESISETPA